MENVHTIPSLPRAKSPEEVGVRTQAVIDWIRDCEQSGCEIHSFMILRHGKVAAEVWRKPFEPGVAHTMFSHSKSFTSVAVGFAIEEGLLTLDTKVCDLFPHVGKQSRTAKSLTVRHLLMMSSGKMDNPFLFLKKNPDWVRDFLRRNFLFKPGRRFLYTSANTYLLCAIVHKVTGKTVTEYLTPRLFEPLGIAIPFWETDPTGTETGGWGLQIRTEDQAKFIHCCLNGGMWEGRQVIPKKWLDAATTRQIDNAPGTPDNCVGYGYQFWQCHIANSFRADGLYSQFAIALRDYDACIVINGGEPEEPKTLEILWRHFPAGFFNGTLEQTAQEREKLQLAIDAFELPSVDTAPRRAEVEQAVDRRTIRLKSRRFASVMGPVNLLLMAKKPGRINDLSLHFTPEGVEFSWQEQNSPRNTLLAGMDGQYRKSTIQLSTMKLTMVSKAAWREDGSLELFIRPLELVQARRMIFRFDGDRVRIHSKAEHSLRRLITFYLGFIGIKSGIQKGAFARLTGKLGNRIATPVVDPDLKGKFVD